MSRREARDSDSKRHRSKFDKEPSPKRSRRDGKPATERIRSNPNLDIGDTDRNQKHRQRLQDALPLEPPFAPDSKEETGAVSKESEKKTNGIKESDEKTSGPPVGTKHSSDPTEVPRSRSYFQQHDERGNARQVGRSFGRRAATERGWWRDSKDQHSERAANKTGNYDTQQRDEKSQARGDDNRVWRHDGFFEMEANPPQPTRKRPAFREKKIPADSEKVDKAAIEPVKPSRPDRPLSGNERREDRAGRNTHHLDRPEKPFAGDRKPPSRVQSQRFGPSRERYGDGGVGGGGSGNYRGRDRFSGRQGYRSSSRVEKWKHDLYDESNRSPTPKNEEDQVAKVEALLAS